MKRETYNIKRNHKLRKMQRDKNNSYLKICKGLQTNMLEFFFVDARFNNTESTVESPGVFFDLERRRMERRRFKESLYTGGVMRGSPQRSYWISSAGRR